MNSIGEIIDSIFKGDSSLLRAREAHQVLINEHEALSSWLKELDDLLNDIIVIQQQQQTKTSKDETLVRLELVNKRNFYFTKLLQMNVMLEETCTHLISCEIHFQQQLEFEMSK